jgi:hypothetical protein
MCLIIGTHAKLLKAKRIFGPLSTIVCQYDIFPNKIAYQLPVSYQHVNFYNDLSLPV